MSQHHSSLITLSDPRSPAAEAFRTLRTNIYFSGLDRSIHTLLVTSVAPSEGKSTTIANLALRDALSRRSARYRGKPDQIIGATKDIQDGEVMPMPAIEFGSVKILDAGVTFADIYIFKQWKLLNEPAILIGMDALGLLDTLVIDYRRHELQMRMPRGGAG